MSAPYYGKYRGSVVSNIDPLKLGRITAIVPDVSGAIPTTWAMPCLPVAGLNSGIFTVPAIGSGVWVEFEQGDPERPIWVGGYWGTGAEVPGLAKKVPPGIGAITLQTKLKNGIVISDAPGPLGGITITAASGAKITVNDLGIAISNGKGAAIKLQGPSVDVNSGALKVT